MSTLSYPPIDAHGLIGDQRTAALVANDGSIAWCCLPDFDGDIVFGALLDRASGGSWRVGPAEAIPGEQRYVENTAVLETCWTQEDRELRLLDSMALASDADSDHTPTFLRRLRCEKGACECVMDLSPRLNFKSGTSSFALWTSHPGVARDYMAMDPCTFSLGEGDEFWVVLSWGSAPPRIDSVEQARIAMEETQSRWQRWAIRHPWFGPHRAEVLASQRAIRLLGHARLGSQVAAPTTSLPEKLGGDRNYDYRYAWVRDSSLALAILAVFGDLPVAERYMDWLAARDPGGQMPLQVLYRIDGGTSAPERELDGVEGYAGSRPVRIGNHAVEQFQLDSLGYLADCALIYLQQGGAWKPAYSRMLDSVAEFTADHWRLPDHGIWELAEQRHYVSSKAMSWAALERACRIRERLGEPVPSRWRSEQEAIHSDVMDRGWSEALQSFRQHYDADELDASTLLLSLMEFVPADHPRMVATVSAVQRDLQRGGFVWRFHPRSVGRPELPVQGMEGAFVPCAFWLASALARQGRSQEAQELIERVEASFAALHLFPEEFDPGARRALGNYPLLFSHAEHLRAIMDLAKSRPSGLVGMMAGKAAGAIVRAIAGEAT